MKLKKVLFMFATLSLLSGCNDYENIMAPIMKEKMKETNSNPVYDGTAEPPIPDQDENNRTILGIDSDKNNIRDDIDIWINRTGKSYNQRMVLRQLARAYREQWIIGSLTLDLYNKGPIDQDSEKEMAYYKELGNKVQEAIVKIANTRARCMERIYSKHGYQKTQNLAEILKKLYGNTSSREKANDAFYSFNHIYSIKMSGDDYDYCDFKPIAEE